MQFFFFIFLTRWLLDRAQREASFCVSTLREMAEKESEIVTIVGSSVTFSYSSSSCIFLIRRLEGQSGLILCIRD